MGLALPLPYFQTYKRRQRMGLLAKPQLRSVKAASQRCGAKTRNGTPCKAWAMRLKRRCRMHGGKSTGPSKKALCDSF
ncbi:HGGxSTG domain-containing protein [Aliiroseovarius sp. KMU-71]|uniref:HGGxSTG domain-containing protein n=1 Tax=Aliiroseovarius sp. KMU-71 TaxID=3453123 RepID=UPI003F4811FD